MKRFNSSLALLGAVTAMFLARNAMAATSTEAAVAAPTKAGTSISAVERGEPQVRAQLSPRRHTTISAELGARVLRVLASEGGAIRQGQLLVTLDCATQQAQLQRAIVALDVAGRQLQTQSRLAELNATGRLEVEAAEGEIRKLRAEVALIEVQLARCSVLAPFSGRVAEKKVREQQYVQPGQPLLEIIDDSVLEIEFIMPSRWLGRIRPGSPVQIAVDETGRIYAARVLRVGARVDPVSQSVKVVAALSGRPSELVAGMSGRLLLGQR